MKKLLPLSWILGIGISMSFTFCEPTSSPSENKAKPNLESTLEKLPLAVFLGDSLTAGLGLESVSLSYPSLLQKEAEKQGKKIRILNAGVSGDTTSGGLERLDWVLEEEPFLFVLELGANDMMRGVPPKTIESNLREILKRVRQKYPRSKLLLIGMRAFPNLGAKYSQEFEAIFPRIATSEGIALVPFLLDGVAGDRSLNQKDGIHPTAEGHKILSGNVWKVFQKLLESLPR